MLFKAALACIYQNTSELAASSFISLGILPLRSAMKQVSSTTMMSPIIAVLFQMGTLLKKHNFYQDIVKHRVQTNAGISGDS